MLRKTPAHIAFEVYSAVTGQPITNAAGTSWTATITQDTTTKSTYSPVVNAVDLVNSPGWYSFVLPATFTDCAHLFIELKHTNADYQAEPWESDVESYMDSATAFPSVEAIQEGLAKEASVQTGLGLLNDIKTKQTKQATGDDVTALGQLIGNVQKTGDDIYGVVTKLPSSFTLTQEQIDLIANTVLTIGNPSLQLFLSAVFNSIISNGTMEVQLPDGTIKRFSVAAVANANPIVSVRPMD